MHLQAHRCDGSRLTLIRQLNFVSPFDVGMTSVCVPAVFQLRALSHCFIDTARDIYKNATLEKTALIRLLISREKATEKIIASWDHRLIVCISPSLKRLLLTDFSVVRICKKLSRNCSQPPQASALQPMKSIRGWQRMWLMCANIFSILRQSMRIIRPSCC